MTAVLRGKVREMHPVGDDRLVMVASDRISAYDGVMPNEIPDKGRALTGLSLHWFAKTRDIVPNHLIATDTAEMPPEFDDPAHRGRALLVTRLRMLPIECVARGYLAGSGWRDYLDRGEVCGHRLPEGLRQADRLPEPIFTPATKATDGHDENIDAAAAADLVGREMLERLEEVTLALYRRAADICRRAGIILADTKFEFGIDADERLVLADEALTSDSSRFWPADAWAPGASPPSFDKQYVRDWLDEIGWDHQPPAPKLPPEVVRGTRDRYAEAFERISGRSFDDYLREGP
ncbi:MAG: phosphoribosylaminoimidazolesuccinocarboxamide synthase [Miltoncostaeaceae bacterium]